MMALIWFSAALVSGLASLVLAMVGVSTERFIWVGLGMCLLLGSLALALHAGTLSQ